MAGRDQEHGAMAIIEQTEGRLFGSPKRETLADGCKHCTMRCPRLLKAPSWRLTMTGASPA